MINRLKSIFKASAYGLPFGVAYYCIQNNKSTEIIMDEKINNMNE